MEDSIHHWKAAVSLRLADPRRQAFLRWRHRCAGVLRAWVVPSGRIAITAAYDALLDAPERMRLCGRSIHRRRANASSTSKRPSSTV